KTHAHSGGELLVELSVEPKIAVKVMVPLEFRLDVIQLKVSRVQFQSGDFAQGVARAQAGIVNGDGNKVAHSAVFELAVEEIEICSHRQSGKGVTRGEPERRVDVIVNAVVGIEVGGGGVIQAQEALRPGFVVGRRVVEQAAELVQGDGTRHGGTDVA